MELQTVPQRPLHALEKEENDQELKDLLTGTLAQQLASDTNFTGSSEAALVSARRHRLKTEPCLIPADLACRIPAGENGCFDAQFSHDGQYIAVACTEGNMFPIHVYDVSTVSLRYTLLGHQGLVYELNWCKVDGKSPKVLQLASASADGTVRIWSVPSIWAVGSKTSKEKDEPQVNSDEENEESDANSDNELLGKKSKKHKKKGKGEIEEVQAGCEFILQHTPPTYVYTVQFHPLAADPPFVATGAYDQFIRLWDCSSGELLGKLDRGNAHHKSHINTLCFTNDGNRLISGDGNGIINIWRLETGRQPSNPDAWHLARKIDDPDLRGRAITTVQVHPVERLLLVSAQQNVIRLFELRRYTRMHQGFIGAPVSQSLIRACFSPDGEYVMSGGEDGKPHVWHTKNAVPVANKQWKFGFPKPICSLSWHPNEHLVAFCCFNGNFPVLMYEALRDTRDVEAKPIKTSLDEDNVDEEENADKQAKRDDRIQSIQQERTEKIAKKLNKGFDSGGSDEENEDRPETDGVKTQLKGINSLRKKFSKKSDDSDSDSVEL
mmetsp:Transcript_14175/g.25165  ORF Transcript_14175/g.25165 Transcript_14175/m.25165 type:complete len:551 (+) Transcript_14175:3-1655(+)